MIYTEELPEGWSPATLADLGVWSSGGTPNKKRPEFHRGNIPWVLTGDLEDGPLNSAPNSITQAGLDGSSAKLFPKETLLMAMYGATIGRLGILKFEAATNQACAALLPNEANRECLLFVYYFLLSKRESFKKAGKGGAQPNISQTVIKETAIPVPPLSEQQRIVEKIETLFAQLDKGEEAVREVQKLLTRYRQSVLKSAVTGQLTADWRAEHDGIALLGQILETRAANWPAKGKYKPPGEPDLKEFSKELPSGWVWTSVDQILRAGLSNGRSVPDAEDDGFPVMRLTALKDGVIDVSERKQGAWSADDAKPFLVEKGDILVSRGNGSKKLVGRGGLIADEVDAVAYPDTMIRIPIDLEHLSAEWFVQLWNSPFMRMQIEKAAKTTAGIYKINQGDIRGFVVPLPSLEEQKQIALVVSEVTSKIVELEIWCETELKRSASLRQSILKDAFSGRLVPQDPSDEPASALLARIAAAKTPKTKSRRKTRA